MAFIVWVLGAVDILLTHLGLTLGVISEGNPLMAYLFELSVPAAILFALVLPGAGLYFLHSQATRCRLALQALRGLLFVRIAVFLLHLNWMIRVFSG
ncbi:MAG: hypothetical protein KGZ63_14390 [Clostridiales bacterium]|jgi:hypothetical protein|nr:hypothetical protein [Clostridiales bacterium]